MIDFGFWPQQHGNDFQVFNTISTVSNLQWNTWIKPRGCTMAWMLLLGGGGGGGGGFTGAASAARGGGGGGGSSSQCTLVVPLISLPDVLYVQVGAGGTGTGSGGGTGGSGLLSFVSVYPTSVVNNMLAASGAVSATGGGTGTGAAVGAAGVGGTVATLANMPFGSLGVFQSIAGQSGVAGGSQNGAAGTFQPLPVSGILVTAGAGGAGTKSADFAGGEFNATPGTLINEVSPTGPPPGSFNGSGGVTLKKPFFNFGGCGGSSSNTGIGGAGGGGAFGSGGGGGGGGTTGGRGGDGGQGIVIIISY